MVPLPLFKLAALFVRHISKYGANRIKSRAHEHPNFRAQAAKYGQMMHQLNMRLNVALLRNTEAELKAKEKAETPTVKTKEETEKEEVRKAKQSKNGQDAQPISVWKRKFRPLPEAKAVDLFADVVGDGFILLVATALIFWETWRTSRKPDANKDRINELEVRFKDLQRKEENHEEEEKRQQDRIAQLEMALRNYTDPRTKQPLLPASTAS